MPQVKSESTPEIVIPKSDPQSLEVLSNFIHQVINPLNGVLGTLDNLIDGTIGDDRRDQRLRAVRSQLEWSILLVRNLAYFTRTSLVPGAPRDEDLTKTCVLPQLIIEAAQFFQEPGQSRGVTIRLTDRATQYAVSGSPDLLRQVFMNLFDNAVKYSDNDTEVTISPRVQKKTNHLIVEVTNVGPGFTTKEQSRLFDAGFRGAAAERIIKSGTGLGLHICRKILEDIHNATIDAEHSSKMGETTFRLKFSTWRRA